MEDISWIQEIAKHARRKRLLEDSIKKPQKKYDVTKMDWRELHYVAKHHLKNDKR